MPINQSTLSRFYGNTPIKINGQPTYGLWNKPEVVKHENYNEQDIIAVVIDQRTAGRPDVIAQDEYQTPLLEWVVVMYNRPLNTIGWPRAGMVIKIPSNTALRRFL
jgi:hypothetical protein